LLHGAPKGGHGKEKQKGAKIRWSSTGLAEPLSFTLKLETQEEIRDLLLADAQSGQSVHIREVPGGGICLAGATEKEVVSKAQMADLLSQGTLQVRIV